MDKLKDVVRAATASEEKKSALLDEVKLAVQNERETLKAKEKEVEKDKNQLNEYKKIKEEEILALRREVDDSVFKVKELKQKYEDTTQRYNTLDIEHRALLQKCESHEKRINHLQ